MVTLSDGTPLFELEVQIPAAKVVGYQIKHKLTNRILPGTTRKEVYTKGAAINKMNQVNSMYMVMQCPLDIWDYELIDVLDIDCPADPVFITSPNDYLFE